MTNDFGIAQGAATSALFFFARFVFLLTNLFSASLHAAPYVPKSDDEVLERLKSRPGAELGKLRAQLAAAPEDLDLALKLSRRYIEQSRAESDPRYLGYAEAALKPWWDLPQPPVNVLVLRATLKQSVHDFDGALGDLALALKLDPRNAQAWLTRATIHQVRGEYERARESCKALLRLARSALGEACIGELDALSGRAAKGYEHLRAVYDRGADQSVRSWMLTGLAQIAERLGRDADAEAHYRDALSSRDSFALGAYADFLLDRNRASEVASLLKDETRADGLLLRLALAEKALVAPKLKQHVAALTARFHASRLRGDAVHLREEARFNLHLLEKPEEALELAQRNWQVQREPADARILLEAALAANDLQAALPVLKFLQETGLEDARLQPLVARLKRKAER